MSDREAKAVAGVAKDLFIGGAWIPAENKRTFPVEDPSTELEIAKVADASPADGAAALDAAVAIQDAWANTPARERSEVLRRTFELITVRAEQLALVMTLEMGKPIKESRAEVRYAAEFFRWFSEEAVRIAGRYAVDPTGTSRLVTMKQPVGPCLMITPWNFPLAMGARKIAPAVAAGCTMVVKPAMLTPLSMLALADILTEAGLPPGVVNVITTSRPGDVTQPLVRDPRLRKLTFTGSAAVGRTLVAQSAQGLLRLSLELGGNAPFLVFPDADFDQAVEGAVIAKMRNGGEACTAANRFLVHESIIERFAERLADRLGSLRVGRGVDDNVDVGPLVSQQHSDSVAALVTGALAAGGTMLTGGAMPNDQPGYFCRPTVLVDVPPSAAIYAEEIFGPVAAIYPFSTEDEAITMANDTEYGLVAYAFTADQNRAIRLYENLRTGMVGINQGLVSNPAAPFGGVKASGFGREGGREGIEEYLDVKYVGIAA